MTAASLDVEKTAIDGLLERFSQLKAFLSERNELSLAVEAEANFKKLFVLACGSFFEEQITGAIGRWADAAGNASLAAFVRNKGLERQYHTFFDWKTETNVNRFLALFGDTYKTTMGPLIKDDETIRNGMKAFLWIGQQRNLLAHENLVSAPLTSTIDELAEQYVSALRFVRFLIAHFNEGLRGSQWVIR